MKNALPMTLIIIALLFGSMALGKLLLNPATPVSTQNFEQNENKTRAGEQAKQGITAPAFSAPLIHPEASGNYIFTPQSERYRLVNMWASWCTPCVVEMPDLFSLAADHPDIFELVALSIDSKQEKAHRFFASLITKFGASETHNITALWDQRAQISQNQFGTFQVPESYLISPDGRILKKFPGALDEDSIHEIREILK